MALGTPGTSTPTTIIDWDKFPDWRVIVGAAAFLFVAGLFIWNPPPAQFTLAEAHFIVPIAAVLIMAGFLMRLTPAGTARVVAEVLLLGSLAILLIIPCLAVVAKLFTSIAETRAEIPSNTRVAELHCPAATPEKQVCNFKDNTVLVLGDGNRHLWVDPSPEVGDYKLITGRGNVWTSGNEDMSSAVTLTANGERTLVYWLQ